MRKINSKNYTLNEAASTFTNQTFLDDFLGKDEYHFESLSIISSKGDIHLKEKGFIFETRSSYFVEGKSVSFDAELKLSSVAKIVVDTNKKTISFTMKK